MSFWEREKVARSLERLDKLLVQKGLVSSRSKAQALILAGKVYVNNRRCTKAGAKVPDDSELRLEDEGPVYVSRGGIKLEHALNIFDIDVRGLICMDVGASTGGFTDCLLQRGATRVYAVDVGYGQLDWKLRNDSRVVVLEKQNIRYLQKEAVPEDMDIITIDTSFISLRIVIPSVMKFMAPNATVIALIKPQFEAGRRDVGKGGVVRNAEVHARVKTEISDFVSNLGFHVRGITESPILGPKGNKEFFIVADWEK